MFITTRVTLPVLLLLSFLNLAIRHCQVLLKKRTGKSTAAALTNCPPVSQSGGNLRNIKFGSRKENENLVKKKTRFLFTTRFATDMTWGANQICFSHQHCSISHWAHCSLLNFLDLGIILLRNKLHHERMVLHHCAMTSFSIFYQNFHSQWTKIDKILIAPSLTALMMFWLCHGLVSRMNMSHHFFPDGFYVFRADCDYINGLLKCGGRSALSIKMNIKCFRHPYLELEAHCIGVEFHRVIKCSLLIADHYFTPMFSPEDMKKYFENVTQCISGFSYDIIIQGGLTLQSQLADQKI